MLRLKKKLARSTSSSPVHYILDDGLPYRELIENQRSERAPPVEVGASSDSSYPATAILTNQGAIAIAPKQNVELKQTSQQEHKFEPLPSSTVSLADDEEHEKSKDAANEWLDSALASDGQRLLAMPEDEMNLNGLHCFVRRNTQVFLASQSDIEAPAPGRKKKILPNQVGLRCIHCWHLPTQERVKRAVCYPSSIRRIYHCISDMKFDHFAQCLAMPEDVKKEISHLKQNCNQRKLNRDKNSSRSTARYYQESARKLGIIEKDEGLFVRDFAERVVYTTPQSPLGAKKEEGSFAKDVVSSCPIKPVIKHNTLPPPPRKVSVSRPNKSDRTMFLPIASASVVPHLCDRDRIEFDNAFIHSMNNYANAINLTAAPLAPTVITEDTVLKASSLGPLSSRPRISCFTAQGSMQVQEPGNAIDTTQTTCMLPSPANPENCLLAMADDSLVLNDLHCFVRKNIELFAATQEDVSSPSPGRRNRVAVGQVGIRCIYCCKSPSKDRTKRAVCYPPTVHGIYHCVSNMKFDHFEVCKNIPDATKLRLQQLKKSCNRKGGSQSANCTAQYYSDSAIRLGLADSRMGIRFRVKPEMKTQGVKQMPALPIRDSATGVGVGAGGIYALALAASRADPAPSMHGFNFQVPAAACEPNRMLADKYAYESYCKRTVPFFDAKEEPLESSPKRMRVAEVCSTR
jgi:hypothetical protein